MRAYVGAYFVRQHHCSKEKTKEDEMPRCIALGPVPSFSLPFQSNWKVMSSARTVWNVSLLSLATFVSDQFFLSTLTIVCSRPTMFEHQTYYVWTSDKGPASWDCNMRKTKYSEICRSVQGQSEMAFSRGLSATNTFKYSFSYIYN